MTTPALTTRDFIGERLAVDLIGPAAVDEQLTDRPLDRYLSGMLWPQNTEYGQDDDDGGDRNAAEDGEEGEGQSEELPMSSLRKPSSMGLAFQLHRADGVYGISGMRLPVRVSGGRYTRVRLSAGEEGSGGAAQGAKLLWKRVPFDWHGEIAMQGVSTIAFGERETLSLHARCFETEDAAIVSVSLVNDCDIGERGSGVMRDEGTLFQATLTVLRPPACVFLPQPIRSGGEDADARSAELLFRDVKTYAFGLVASAEWQCDEKGVCQLVRTTWLPQADVRLVSAEGSEVLVEAIGRNTASGKLEAATLAAGGEAMLAMTSAVADGYARWIALQRERADAQVPQAQEHLSGCERAQARIAAGVRLLGDQEDVRSAFQLMNEAIDLQSRWNSPAADPFAWRPFQLAFILQNLESLSNPDSADRRVMDLLWFPTGGGKTEAYLGLIAFSAFLRRIRTKEERGGGGVCCLMRYTLRLLTLQQFERASTLICACEFLRRKGGRSAVDLRSAAPISIGLWVGGSATPNTVEDAIKAEKEGGGVTHAQLTSCPCCKGKVVWRIGRKEPRVTASCENPNCELAVTVPVLPILTVDDVIYNYPPTLLIGTVDKFAQLVRSERSRALFGSGINPPPELIIQDELHLISGPLGSMTGLYEVAIDMLCEHNGNPVKIIGSTATIRRAGDQVKQLFAREVEQFPPPGIDAADSCFAVVPRDAGSRRYLGITTAGRSAKFVLQAVMASALQAAAHVEEADRDNYHTLLAYFNSLRELGGALPLIQDDVDASIRLTARRRKEAPRPLSLPVELTSRVSQTDIKDTLEGLKVKWPEDGAIDIVVATNMVSVGMDIQRLALMIMMGQPKSIAEYIQATSRVGRGKGAPGLVVAILNNAKIRDRSHFETFGSWHGALYRSVEASSVTPFASRARDRALHATLVLAARHLIPALGTAPKLDDASRAAVEAVARRIVERVAAIDPAEAAETEAELAEVIETWAVRSDSLRSYWTHSDASPEKSLLMGAEEAFARGRTGRGHSSAWPTPNSMRNVEAGTQVQLKETAQA
jgi:hypothetical protein